jgi:hypothetical protein
MGCSHTKEIIRELDEVAAPSSGKPPARLIMSSTGSLEIYLQQARWREQFRKFILDIWVPSITSNTSAYFRTNARIIAVDCMDFWLDARDFSKITKSRFQMYRACYIFEKYLMYGAAHPVRN